MKKLSLLLLSFILSLTLVACGKQESGNSSSGGTFSVEEAEAIELTEGAKEAYESAIEKYTNDQLEVIAYLGSQVVAGTNYKYLVRECPNEETFVGNVYVVVVYEDLDKNAEVTEMTRVEFADYLTESNKFAPEALVGGWDVQAAYGAGLTGDCKEAFEKATADYKDFNLEPICMMDFELAPSVTYIICCKADNGQASGICAVTITVIKDQCTLSYVNAFE